MLVIVAILSCISAAVAAPVYSDENTFILATVLFYKDAKGQIKLASGPVPQLTDFAIRDDLSSRFNGATVKIVPIFNETNTVPKSDDVLGYVKDEYKTVLVAGIPKRLSRNVVKDLWSYYWHGVFGSNKDGAKRKLTTPKHQHNVNMTKTWLINRVKQPVGYKEVSQIFYNVSSTTATALSNTNKEWVDQEDTTNCESCKLAVEAVPAESEEKVYYDKDEPSVLTSADEFIPNDIYYGIEKKCINWSDGCGLQSKYFLNMSSNHFKYVYTRPRIVKWVP